MDQTPTRSSRAKHGEVNVLDQGSQLPQDGMQHGRLRKPAPITPRRFNKFFTPRPQHAAQAVKTSRNALRSISSSHLNTRRNQLLQQHDCLDGYLPSNENQIPRKKRKYSSYSAFGSITSTPDSVAVGFFPSSQDVLPSSPLRGRDNVNVEDVIDHDSDASTQIDEEEWSQDEDDIAVGPRILPYASMSTSRSLLANRIGGRRHMAFANPSHLWQSETANFYTGLGDINDELRERQPPIIPFSMTACNTNPLVATGDEEGVIRFLDPTHSDKDQDGFNRTILNIKPHDNAIMDLVFSSDDKYIATASGDQTCQIIDVQAKQSLYSLRTHTASVKKIQFQPGSGDRILVTAGRDGTVCLWDTRVAGRSMGSGRRARAHVTTMAEDVNVLTPVLEIHDAHNPNAHSSNAKSRALSHKAKQSNVAARNDFSITSLSFLDPSRNNLLATASEVDTVIKLWDLRQSKSSAKKKGHSQVPVSATQEPRSHALHRKFGINSIALSTDSSRLFALSRDHTVYAYSTSHLILGSAPEMIPLDSTSSYRSPFAPANAKNNTGLGPLYGLRHPNLRVVTFWPRLAIRHCTETNTELLAVGSTDDCAILFPTNEKYHSRATQAVPPLHDPIMNCVAQPNSPRRSGRNVVRPSMNRAPTTSFTSLFTKSRQAEDAMALPIYYHGTPLIRGHSKEVTALAWNSDGSLVTASDDFTLRCWREGAEEARKLRGMNIKGQRDEASLTGKGWADVGVRDWDDTD